MGLEQAERFVAAAERDYAAMVGAYRALVTESSPFDVDEVRDARADVLAAQQVLLLARDEAYEARRHAQAGKDYAGVCERCGRQGPRWVVGAAVLCAACAERAEAEGAKAEGEAGRL